MPLTQDFLQSLMPAQSATVDLASFIRRLSATLPGMTISVEGQTVTVAAGRETISAVLPDGVIFASPQVVARSISNANAPVVQSGKAPTDAAD